MKKIKLCLLVAFLYLILAPIHLNARNTTVPTSKSTAVPIESAEANVLLARINEIKLMDKSSLSSMEKKELRKELRSTKNQLKAITGGVYLSAGAVLIIALLLILLL